jgi:hypothetical protein
MDPEEVRFRPEQIHWWGLIDRWSKALCCCHTWLASDHPIGDQWRGVKRITSDNADFPVYFQREKFR